MSSAERNAHAPPSATMDNHPTVLTEHFLASEFTKRYGHLMRRDAYDTGEAFFQLGGVTLDHRPNSKEPYPRYEGCFRLPNWFVVNMLRELAAELERELR